MVGALHKKDISEKKRLLEKELQTLNPETDQVKIYNISTQLKALQDYNTQEAQNRARPKIWLQDEEPSQNFFELEKRKIPNLNRNHNQNDTYPSSLNQKTVFEFFMNKWGTEVPDKNHEEYLKITHTLSEETLQTYTNNACILESEITQAISEFKDNTAPGLDGLTIEFYKTFSKTLSPILLEVYNNIFLRDSILASQKAANVKLLPKAGSSSQINNWRPISLLNLDYKILAKIIANRLTPMLNNYISPNQQCGLPGRHLTFIHQNVLAAMEYCTDTLTPITILQLDFSKAFDSVFDRGAP